MPTTDIEMIKSTYKISQFVDMSKLKKVANTGGGEYAGPCAFCGGRDRFRVQPQNNLWLCRHCTDGKWRDVISYYARLKNIKDGQAIQELSNYKKIEFVRKEKAEILINKYPVYEPPDDSWKVNARKAIDICHENLFSKKGKKALDYLQNKRGFDLDTLNHFRVGYSPGMRIDNLYIEKGITIPCEVNGQLCYVKIRTNGHEERPKYAFVPGSKPAAIFNADDLIPSNDCLLVEGEFNAMIAYQTLNDVIAIASVGSAINRFSMFSWGKYFINKSLILTLYDDDQEGWNGSKYLSQFLGERVKLCMLPDGLDINDYYLREGSSKDALWHWLKEYLIFYQEPLEIALDGMVVRAVT